MLVIVIDISAISAPVKFYLLVNDNHLCLILDEQDDLIRQINDFKDKTSKKDAEISQLQKEIAKAVKVRKKMNDGAPSLERLFYEMSSLSKSISCDEGITVIVNL